MRALALGLLAVALAGCGRPAAGYSPEVETNFMRACEARSSVPGLCACTWDKIEADVSPADFAALERLPAAERETHPLTRQINDYALSCGRELSEADAAKRQ